MIKLKKRGVGWSTVTVEDINNLKLINKIIHDLYKTKSFKLSFSEFARDKYSIF